MYNARIRKKEIPQGVQSSELNISVRRTLNHGAIRMMAAVVATGLLGYVVYLLPTLALFVIPGMLALVERIYNESRYVQYVRYRTPIKNEHLDDTEKLAERLRIHLAENHGLSIIV
ncbi:hypothetical protein EU528_02715 [Candidatus Thorarchaeota archaeon]|nr:MAG: hypothetical protein EU528_02715 [Candidatus Thorarchaeota archaeon]